MSLIFHPLLALIASATDRELAKYIQFLKEENKILRARVPGVIHTFPEERERLLEFAKAIRRAIEELLTIVSPSTFCRWLRDEHGTAKRKKNPKGGQRRPKESREFVLQIATVTGFDDTRILGELRKLGIKKISRQTIRNIFKKDGIQPGPSRTSDSWTNFLERHKEPLLACDFFSVKTMTKHGLRDVHVLVWLCVSTREVNASASTEHPTSAWMSGQARKFIDETVGREHKPDIVMHDRDTKYSKEFTETLKSHGLRSNKFPKRSPNLNGRCEKFIGTIKNECLAKFILFGRKHLDHLVAEFTEYYNQHRSHMCRGHLPPVSDEPEEIATIRLDEIEVKSFVGGLVKGFRRTAVRLALTGSLAVDKSLPVAIDPQ